jgi:hypothetical protein
VTASTVPSVEALPTTGRPLGEVEEVRVAMTTPTDAWVMASR